MADKKMTAAEKKAAAEAAVQIETDRRATERKRLIGAGAVLAAIALFVGGYAIGNSGDNESFIGAERVFDAPTDRLPPFDLRPGDRFPGPRGDHEFPEGFEFPGPRGGFEFPEGFEFPGPRGGFDFELPERLDFPGGGFGLGFDCFPSDAVRGGFHCEFSFPDVFEFPFPGGPFSGDELIPDPPPTADEIPAEPGFLGVAVEQGPDGVVVVELFTGSPAVSGGIEVGDVIVAADGTAVETVDDLIGIVSEAGAGNGIGVTVVREGSVMDFQVILGERPN